MYALAIVTAAMALAGGLLVAAVLALRAFGGRGERPLAPALEEARAALGLSRCTGRWVPPACAGEVEGARVLLCTGPRASTGGDALVQAVTLLVDVGLHPGMPTTAVAETGLTMLLPEGVLLLGGASLFSGSGADLAIRSRWPGGWDTLYLHGAPTPGKVTGASLVAALRSLLDLRGELRAQVP